jgi:2',3'-cyclic-nucleotide 2'-phosphodiesterase (5'-nucleotidase family)
LQQHLNNSFPPILLQDDVYELENFPHFKSLVDDLSGKADTTLVILTGDFLAPSLLSSLDKGRGMVDCMNFANITHVCLGNHEADVSMNDLKERINKNSKFKWINTNMRELDSNIAVTTLPHDVVDVRHKKIGLLGLLTEDPSVYRPGVFAGSTIQPIIETTETYMRQVIDPLRLDMVIPLTHQRMNDDRKFMHTFGRRFPLILGGHDHEIYDETLCESRCIKTGMDGNHTAIHDLVWPCDQDTNDQQPTITVQIVPTNSYPPCPQMLRKVTAHEKVLQELHRAKLFRFQDWLGSRGDHPHNDDRSTDRFTTKDNRLGKDNGTGVFATILRMGMRAECGLMNAGNIRAGKTYPEEQEWFTWSDLKAEIPFTVGMTAVPLPGWLIQDVINESRSNARQVPPVTSGGYITTCDNIVFDEEQQRIVSIQGHTFDAQRMYLTSFPANWFEGMDQHLPLLEWAKGSYYENSKESSARPSKEVVVEVFSALLWLEIGSFEELDTNSDGFITRDEIRAAALHHFGDDIADMVVDNVFSVADCDRDGKISPVDMMVVKYVAGDMRNHVATEEEIETMQKVAAETLGKHPTDVEVRRTMKLLKLVLDQNYDGKITRLESMAAIGEVRRRSLLM